MDTKEQLKLLNKEIDEKTYQRNLIYSIENELNSLNHNIKQCINLISSSVKGKKANEIFWNRHSDRRLYTIHKKQKRVCFQMQRQGIIA